MTTQIQKIENGLNILVRNDIINHWSRFGSTWRIYMDSSGRNFEFPTESVLIFTVGAIITLEKIQTKAEVEQAIKKLLNEDE